MFKKTLDLSSSGAKKSGLKRSAIQRDNNNSPTEEQISPPLKEEPNSLRSERTVGIPVKIQKVIKQAIEDVPAISSAQNNTLAPPTHEDKNVLYLHVVSEELQAYCISYVQRRSILVTNGESDTQKWCLKFVPSEYSNNPDDVANDYGRIAIPKKFLTQALPHKIMAHHIVLCFLFKQFPETADKVASHLCKHKWCVASNHLFWEDNLSNRSRDSKQCPGGERLHLWNCQMFEICKQVIKPFLLSQETSFHWGRTIS